MRRKATGLKLRRVFGVALGILTAIGGFVEKHRRLVGQHHDQDGQRRRAAGWPLGGVVVIEHLPDQVGCTWRSSLPVAADHVEAGAVGAPGHKTARTRTAAPRRRGRPPHK